FATFATLAAPTVILLRYRAQRLIQPTSHRRLLAAEIYLIFSDKKSVGKFGRTTTTSLPLSVSPGTQLETERQSSVPVAVSITKTRSSTMSSSHVRCCSRRDCSMTFARFVRAGL